MKYIFHCLKYFKKKRKKCHEKSATHLHPIFKTLPLLLYQSFSFCGKKTEPLRFGRIMESPSPFVKGEMSHHITSTIFSCFQQTFDVPDTPKGIW